MVFLLFWAVALVASALWFRPEASLWERVLFGLQVGVPVSFLLIVLGSLTLNFLASLQRS